MFSIFLTPDILTQWVAKVTDIYNEIDIVFDEGKELHGEEEHVQDFVTERLIIV